ncbi:MAG: DUF2339 domain-containing protein [Actinomycetota bacterium]|nr:DUF2339 domain-containing protein [Actinomycetota bacterium]
MSPTDRERLWELEAEVNNLKRRLAQIEREVRPGGATESSSPAVALRARPPDRSEALDPRPALPRPAPAFRPVVRPTIDIEDLLGGRVLALVGGLAVLLGLAFLVALAADRGWLDETARVALAFSASAALVGSGAWLYERKQRSQAALAAAGTGMAGLFLSLGAATALYELVPTIPGLVTALAIGAAATAVSLRWNSRTVAALGILGALVSPTLTGSLSTTEAVAFLAVAYAAACAVVVWRRWEWLRIAAFAVAMTELVVWALDDRPVEELVTALGAFGLLNLVAAVGHELRVPAERLLGPSALLVSASAIVVGGIGALALGDEYGIRASGIWLAGLAGVHAVFGFGLLARRPSRAVGLVLLGAALTLADVAFAMLVDGPALAIGWAASAIALAALARGRSGHDGLGHTALGSQLSLAIAHTLMFDAPPGSVANGEPERDALSVVAVIAASAFGCARLAGKENRTREVVFDAAAAVALAYVTAIALDGLPLVLAYAAEAVALAEVVRRTHDRVAEGAAAGFLILAAGHILAFEAPPDALVYGVDSLTAAAAAVGAFVAASLRIARRLPAGARLPRRVFELAAGVAVLYAGSVGIIDAFQPGEDTLATGLGIEIRQQGQAVMSAFWSLAGLALLWAGLRRGARELRLAGFALLALAVGKVFLYDLAALEAEWRVVSFIVLGLLLLAAAFAYQRMRRDAVGGTA